MLNLSLLRLSREHRRWRHVDAYDAHSLVWAAFPGIDPAGTERPFLFSLDAHAAHHSLLVQSDRAPDWTRLSGGLDGVEVQEKTFDERIPGAGAPARFIVRANPTMSIGAAPPTRDRPSGEPDRHRPRGLRAPVGALPFAQADTPESADERARRREAALRDWLRRRGEAGGFSIDDAEVLVGPTVRREIARPAPDHRRRRPMIFDEVEFTGLLSVTDTDAFAATRAAGIGRGRAFGFGLLMIRPPLSR